MPARTVAIHQTAVPVWAGGAHASSAIDVRLIAALDEIHASARGRESTADVSAALVVRIGAAGHDATDAVGAAGLARQARPAGRAARSVAAEQVVGGAVAACALGAD